MDEPQVVKWREAVYGEEEYGMEWLPTGNYVTEEYEEISVESPVKNKSKIADYNICPIGSIEVELACLKNVETKEYDGGCPDGYVAGEEVLGVNFEDTETHKKRFVGIAEPETMKLDVFEPLYSGKIKVYPSTRKVCVKRTNMPINKENVEVVIDSIVGTGAFQEFPYWYIDWGYFDHLADVSYKKGLDIVGDGHRACFHDYKYTGCYYFKDKNKAKDLQNIFNDYEEGKINDITLDAILDDLKHNDDFIGHNYDDAGGEPCYEERDWNYKKVLLCEVDRDNEKSLVFVRK